MLKRLIIFLIILAVSFPFAFNYLSKMSRASIIPANIVVDANKVSEPFPSRWKALAQGGEESGVRMFEPVIPQISALLPSYIRIDHIYDFYNVVSRDSSKNLVLNFTNLDQTVCDIYQTGAKPFFALGYMPPVMSEDGSLIGKPTNWNEWSFLVQKTIERYSSKSNVLPCTLPNDSYKTDIYYEVWNEPDLESFGKWILYGDKTYFSLYSFSIKGAQQAQNIFPFKIGGPATTALYKNWTNGFLSYISDNNLRIDFLSWHHYSKKTGDYTEDIIKLNKWLGESSKYNKYENLPKIITEWGYDPEKNPIADTKVGAAHMIASYRNILNAKLEMAFLFEIKDGLSPSWGILTYGGQEKPRYKALKLLNVLDGNKLIIEGEGSEVSGMASIRGEKINLILTNYNETGRNNIEAVPITFKNLKSNKYSLTKKYLDGRSDTTLNLRPVGGQIQIREQTAVIMKAHEVISIELKPTL